MGWSSRPPLWGQLNLCLGSRTGGGLWSHCQYSECICSHRKTTRQFKETGRGSWGDGQGCCGSGEKLVCRAVIWFAGL